MQIPRDPAYLPVYHSDGTKQPDHNNNGVVLANGTTYYVPFGGEASTLNDVHIQWDAAIILTSVEVEFSCNPDVNPWTGTAGEFVKNNLVGAFGSLQASSGTVTALTLAVAGGTAGGAVWNVAVGARRGRLKVVVGATGGRMKFTTNGKA